MEVGHRDRAGKKSKQADLVSACLLLIAGVVKRHPISRRLGYWVDSRWAVLTHLESITDLDTTSC